MDLYISVLYSFTPWDRIQDEIQSSTVYPLEHINNDVELHHPK